MVAGVTNDTGRAKLISSDNTTSGTEFGGNASRGSDAALVGDFGTFILGRGSRKRSDGIDAVMNDAVKQTPEEDTTNNTRKREPNINLLAVLGLFAGIGIVYQYKAIMNKSAIEPQTVNTTSQIESAKGSLQADFISRMTFEAAPAPQAQPAQNKVQAPALKL